MKNTEQMTITINDYLDFRRGKNKDISILDKCGVIDGIIATEIVSRFGKIYAYSKYETYSGEGDGSLGYRIKTRKGEFNLVFYNHRSDNILVNQIFVDVPSLMRNEKINQLLE